MKPEPVPTYVTSGAISGARRFSIFAGCFLLLALLGWIDYVTGYELGFFVFYSVPVGLAAWYLGRWPAVGVSFGASITWWLADLYSGARYSAPFYYYWNGAVHFAAFLINAVAIARIKADLDQRQVLARELESARQALTAVASLLSACPACGIPYERARAIDPAPAATLTPLQSELQTALCPSCRERLRSETAAKGRPGGS